MKSLNTINFLLMYSDNNFQIGSDINTYEPKWYLL